MSSSLFSNEFFFSKKYGCPRVWLGLRQGSIWILAYMHMPVMNRCMSCTVCIHIFTCDRLHYLTGVQLELTGGYRPLPLPGYTMAWDRACASRGGKFVISGGFPLPKPAL